MPLGHTILIESKVPKAILLFGISVYFVSCNYKNQYKRDLPTITGATADIIASIDYKSVGCFGGETSNLKIITVEKETRAILTLNKTKYATTLDSSKIQAYNKFIKELKYRDFGIGCTTTNFYSVEIGNEKIERKDDGCSWEGFNTLKYALFEQEMQQDLNSYK